jgi:antitoxin component YwqK of YwqJK toxin-antitoxin module
MKHLFVLIIWSVSIHFLAYSQQDVSDVSKPVFDDEINLPLLPAYENNLLLKTDALKGSRNILIEKKTKNTGIYWGLTKENDTLFTAGYKRKKLHGHWQSWNNSGQIIDSGRMDNNVPDGEWKSWFANGQLRTVRTYSAHKLLMTQNEVKHHNHKTSLNTLAIKEKMNPGTFKHYTNPGYSYKGYLPASLLHNLANTSLTDRSLQNRKTEKNYMPPFNQCYHEGLYMNYYSNGAIKDSGFYHNGLRNGMWIESLEDGNIVSKGAYSNGKKIHSWSYYNKNGKLMALKFYNNQGQEINSKKYHP